MLLPARFHWFEVHLEYILIGAFSSASRFRNHASLNIHSCVSLDQQMVAKGYYGKANMMRQNVQYAFLHVSCTIVP